MPLVNYRGSEEAVLHFAHCVSATYPSAKQVLNLTTSEAGARGSAYKLDCVVGENRRDE